MDGPTSPPFGTSSTIASLSSLTLPEASTSATLAAYFPSSSRARNAASITTNGSSPASLSNPATVVVSTSDGARTLTHTATCSSSPTFPSMASRAATASSSLLGRVIRLDSARTPRSTGPSPPPPATSNVAPVGGPWRPSAPTSVSVSSHLPAGKTVESMPSLPLPRAPSIPASAAGSSWRTTPSGVARATSSDLTRRRPAANPKSTSISPRSSAAGTVSLSIEGPPRVRADGLEGMRPFAGRLRWVPSLDSRGYWAESRRSMSATGSSGGGAGRRRRPLPLPSGRRCGRLRASARACSSPSSGTRAPGGSPPTA